MLAHMCVRVWMRLSLYANIYKFVERSIAVTSVSAINLHGTHTHSFLHSLTHSLVLLLVCVCVYDDKQHSKRENASVFEFKRNCFVRITSHFNGMESIRIYSSNGCISLMTRVCVCEYAFQNIKRHHSHIWLNFFFHFIFEL